MLEVSNNGNGERSLGIGILPLRMKQNIAGLSDLSLAKKVISDIFRTHGSKVDELYAW